MRTALDRFRRSASGRRARDAGENFEGWLNTQHEKARLLGLIAWHRHVGPKVEWKGKGKAAKPKATDVGPADWMLQAMDGRAIVMEAKSRLASRGPLMLHHDLEKHQRDHLAACARGGGLALLLVEFRIELKAKNGLDFQRGSGVVHVPAFSTWSLRRFAVPWEQVPWRVRSHAEGVDCLDLIDWEIRPSLDCYLRPFLDATSIPPGVGPRQAPLCANPAHDNCDHEGKATP